MNKILVLSALALTASLLPARAQYVDSSGYANSPNRSYIDQLMIDRMNARRLKARLAKKRAGRKSTASKTKSAQAPTKAPARSKFASTGAALPSYAYIFIARDPFQSFHLDDAQGYLVSFSFVPVGKTAKPIVRSFRYNFYDNEAQLGAVPIGNYQVSGRATFGGKTHLISLATEAGTPTNPRGGNFALKTSLQITKGLDNYHQNVYKTSPRSLYVRVIE